MTGRAKKYFQTLLGHRIVFQTSVIEFPSIKYKRKSVFQDVGFLYTDPPFMGQSEFEITRKRIEKEMVDAIGISPLMMEYDPNISVRGTNPYRPGGIIEVARARDSFLGAQALVG